MFGVTCAGHVECSIKGNGRGQRHKALLQQRAPLHVAYAWPTRKEGLCLPTTSLLLQRRDSHYNIHTSSLSTAPCGHPVPGALVTKGRGRKERKRVPVHTSHSVEEKTKERRPRPHGIPVPRQGLQCPAGHRVLSTALHIHSCLGVGFTQCPTLFPCRLVLRKWGVSAPRRRGT